MQPCDIVRDSHSDSRCSTVSLPLRHLLHKGFMSFPIFYKCPFRPRCPVSRPITTDTCCLLMFISLIALPCWGPSMRALECLQSLCGCKWQVNLQERELWEGLGVDGRTILERILKKYVSIRGIGLILLSIGIMGKRPLGSPIRRWEDNITMDLKKICVNTRNWVD